MEKHQGSRKSRERWSAIVEAAEETFHAKGYADSTTKDIADKVGVLKGSLYYYIDSKEDLLFEILRDVHEQGSLAIQDVTSRNLNALTKIRLTVSAHAHQVAVNQRKYTIYFHDFRLLSGERLSALMEERDAYENAFRALLVAAQEEGSACPELDVRTATQAILGMINSLYLWFRHTDGAATTRVAEQIADLAVQSIACSSSTHTPGHRRELGLAAAATTRPTA